MTASAQLLLSALSEQALSKQVPDQSARRVVAHTSHSGPDSHRPAGARATAVTMPEAVTAPEAGPHAPMVPLTSEPPLADAAPLTSEPAYTESTPLTSEPTAYAAAGGPESPGA
ncbi:hypothetical protein C6N75_27220 [Streptomyces solincola]|uniref:Uncharacterized protein n=1 Tax=Streptomyces solincola TaxID=2100817 RepID=A0A2S9PP04_9ACTN|nr:MULTISPECIES: hypothetical protein [Streptomyces]PRH76139.1 hypothetical protein C6N75_27220 [Streptomyces solincola]